MHAKKSSYLVSPKTTIEEYNTHMALPVVREESPVLKGQATPKFKLYCNLRSYAILIIEGLISKRNVARVIQSLFFFLVENMNLRDVNIKKI